ncbi:MAG TPA: ATP-binding protein [Vicinamibacterales bacterium]|jgi:PAS domain S-box-containing protein
MNLEAVASLGIRLSQLSDRKEAGRAASLGLTEAFEADAAVVWLPPDSGPCRAEDVFASGSVVPDGAARELARVLRDGGLERWFAARGAAVSTAAAIGAAGTPFGLLAVGWQRSPFNSSRIEVFLALVAEQLRSVLAREQLVCQAAAGTGDPEQHPLVRTLRRDITVLQQELTRSQRAIPEDGSTTTRQRTIIESTSDYVFVKDIWGRYVDVNAAYLAALGVSAADVLGKRDGDLFPPELADEHTAREHIAQISGQTLEDETTWTLGKRHRHLLVRRSPWRNAEGHTVGVVTVATDITERKEAEVQRQTALDALRTANERMQQLLAEQMRLSQRGSALLELTRRLTLESDAESIYRVVVETAEQQLQDACALIANCDPGGPTFAVRCSGGRALTLRHASGLKHGVEASFGGEVMGERGTTSVLLDPGYRFDAALIEDGLRAATVLPIVAAGRPQPVLVIGWPDARQCSPEDLWFLENLAVQLGLAVKNARLYSDLRQSLLSLRDAQQELSRGQRVRALGDLASGIAHKFNNSLTSILGLTDWLLFTLPEDAAGRQEMSSIRASATEAAGLVKRLHDFGRVAPGGESAGPTDPVDAMRHMPDLLRTRLDEEARRRGVRHDLVMDLNQVPLVRIVPSELREVLLCLVSNAIDAMPAGGQITLRSVESEGRVRLSVLDEGDGVAPEILPHLFEPFFSTKGGEHVGLGLSVSRSVVERYGGSIAVQSRPGSGTTFTLSLPVPVDVPTRATPIVQPQDQNAVRREQLRVLLVDDQHDVLEAVSEMVSALGHRVETATSGALALDALGREEYDVVLTDLGMPDLDGRELARQAMTRHPGLRVILITGWTADLEQTPPQGVSRVLTKPLTIKTLRAALALDGAGVALA